MKKTETEGIEKKQTEEYHEVMEEKLDTEEENDSDVVIPEKSHEEEPYTVVNIDYSKEETE